MPANRMKANSASWRAIVAARRRKIAQLWLRHISQREITEAMARSGERNPETREPWSLFTINADCQFLEGQWRADAKADADTAKGMIRAELIEVRRQAWQDKDMGAVLRAIKQECELLGLDAPTKVNITQSIRDVAESLGIDPDEAVREAMAIVASRR